MRIGFAAPLNVVELVPWLEVEPGTTLPVGMGGTCTTTLLRGLLRNGHHVAAVTFDSSIERAITFRGERLTLEIAPYRSRHRARDYFRTERAFVRSAMTVRRPDVIGAHWAYEFALGSLETRVPTVVSLHDWAPTIVRLMGWRVAPYYTVRLAMQTHSLLRAEVVTANSPVIAERAARWVHRRVPVLPDVFDDCLFDTPSRQLDLERPLLLAANNGFNRVKNTANLLSAFSAVRRKIPTARLELAGEDHGRGGPAEQWAQARSMSDGVTFLGPIPRKELLDLMGRAQLFVHPSREESFGNVLVEAMAQGTPVIAGRSSGAVPWVLDSGRAGLLSDIERPRALASDIVSLMTDPELWAKYSANGRRTSQERFSLSRGTTQYVDLLENYLRGGREFMVKDAP